jgi:hypothetical protein
LRVGAGLSTNICMSTRSTRMSPRPVARSAGKVSEPVPEKRHVAGDVMSSSTRLARTGFSSHARLSAEAREGRSA